MLVEENNLERWKRMLPAPKKVAFIDGAAVFQHYDAAWRLLEDLCVAVNEESFKEYDCVPLRLISRNSLIAWLESCLEEGESVGGSNSDMDSVRRMMARVKLLDPETLIDLEGTQI